MSFSVSSSPASAQLHPALIASTAALPDGYEAEDIVALNSVAGPFNPDTNAGLAPAVGSLSGGYLLDYYYRIWVFPSTLIAQNPQYDTPIPFYVWNAYPQPETNTLELITALNGDGLLIEGDTPAAFGALEYRQMGISITPDAPGSVDASFTFDFTLGAGTFRFVASIANVLALQFEDGIRVEYSWLTDVLQRYNGDEQRLALRERPRRVFAGDIVITNDAERKYLYDQIYKTASGLIVIPMYHHQTPLRAPVVIGDNKIYCNPKRADLRVGGYVLTVKRNGAQILEKIESIAADHVVVEAAHSEAVPVAGTKIMSAATTRLPDNSGLSMRALDGNASLQFMELTAPETLAHPFATVELETYETFPVLTKRPLADDADEKFSAGLTTIDNETGRPARFTAWDQRYVRGERSYLINTQFSPEDLDYWFTFLEHCRGQQRSFLASTWRQDLVPTGNEFTNSSLEVAGTEYAQLYLGTDTYARLELVTSAGTFYVTVSGAEPAGDGTRLAFAPALPGDLTGVTIERVSYLMKQRLGSDKVQILFRNTFAILSLSLKAV